MTIDSLTMRYAAAASALAAGAMLLSACSTGADQAQAPSPQTTAAESAPASPPATQAGGVELPEGAELIHDSGAVYGFTEPYLGDPDDQHVVFRSGDAADYQLTVDPEGQLSALVHDSAGVPADTGDFLLSNVVFFSDDQLQESGITVPQGAIAEDIAVTVDGTELQYGIVRRGADGPTFEPRSLKLSGEFTSDDEGYRHFYLVPGELKDAVENGEAKVELTLADGETVDVPLDEVTYDRLDGVTAYYG